MTLDKSYQPHALEPTHYQRWEAAGYFQPQPAATAYCIMLPPPNVTGSLHMGHAFQDTLMDALIRYHRMCGHGTLWQGGTDHAGIATQMVVERQLAAQGQSRHHLGREAFVQRVWAWKAESGGTITRQLRRMGAAIDWARERFTLDEGLSAAVREVFVRLYEEGLIYRGQRLVNWDPILHTAISDLEVVSSEEAGFLWHIRYPLADGSEGLVVATTRPETLLGDAAVAVHPDDARYQHLIGQNLQLPTTGRLIPVIADRYVDPAFGSGCVKITPAHDFNDYAVWQRHKDTPAFQVLPDNGLFNIFTPDARIRPDPLLPAAYQGLDRYVARKRLLADLEALGLLVETKAHTLMVPRGDRSQAVIEPYLTDQWFVRIEPLAQPAIAAVETGAVRFVPDNWKNTYFDWMRNIQDWCISRQLWWGHRIPAWYGPEGTLYVARTEAEVREKYQLDAAYPLRQDEDVLDTWFSSALWPFSTLGWPARTPELQTFYPTSVLVTGFDIIFFWVARMIMFGLKFMGEVPFREVYIHGLVRDSHGQKMSKSKGNVLDPLDLIDGIDLETLVQKRTTGLMQPELAPKIAQATRKEFPQGIPALGTDALRFAFAALASTGRDINFDLNRVEGYRNFCNKLWNASRFVLMHTEGRDCGLAGDVLELSVYDRWLRTRLQRAEAAVAEHLAVYRFDLAAQALYELVWNDYCDWYLELVKPCLQDATRPAAEQRATRATLVRVLEAILRLLHPFMPYITEELWLKVAPLAGKSGPTLLQQPYPVADPGKLDTEAEAEVIWLQGLILAVRKIRGELDLKPSLAVPLWLRGADPLRLARHAPALQALAKVSQWQLLDPETVPQDVATGVSGDITLFVPLAGLIDQAAERARLSKELDRLHAELARYTAKLANADFRARAPAAVVAKDTARVAELHGAIAALQQQMPR